MSDAQHVPAQVPTDAPRRTRGVWWLVVIPGLAGLAVVIWFLWLAAMFGVFGEWLTPRGEDAAKLESVERLKAGLKVGMAAADAQILLESTGEGWVRICGDSQRRPCPPEYRGAYQATARFRKVKWLGVVHWDVAVFIDVRDETVMDVRIENWGNGP